GTVTVLAGCPPPPPPPAPITTSDYSVTRVGNASIAPGTTLVPGSQCDECTTSIALPFTYYLYGQPYTSAILGSNGTMAFTSNSNNFGNVCLPRTTFSNAIFPHWDDLDTRAIVDPGLGIYTSVSGSAPDRIFNVEWRACRYAGGVCGGDVNVEIQLYEGQG